jgi:hypothetical protein
MSVKFLTIELLYRFQILRSENVSYSLVGKFITKDGKDTQFVNLDFDRLKILNKVRYSVNFEDIDGFDFSRDDEIFTVSFHRKDFEMKLNSIIKQKEELESNISKLNKIRYSAEFYNLSTEGKERFESDESYWKEELDEVKYKIDALVYVTNTFDFVESFLDEENMTLSISSM